MIKYLSFLSFSGLISAQNCSPGFFNNGTGICGSCPTGTFSLASASICTDCPTGFTQLDGSDENVDENSCLTGCDAGFGGSDCAMCPSGTFSKNVTAAIAVEPCTDCALGFTTSGIFPASSCNLCSKGFGGEDCDPCGSGQTSPDQNEPADDECYDTACGFCHRENDICSVTDDSVSPFEFTCVCEEHTDGSIFYGSDCSLNACNHPDVTAKLGAGVETCLSKGNPFSNAPEITCQDGYNTLPGGLYCDNEICATGTCTNGECSIVNGVSYCDCSVADANGETFYGPQCQFSICDFTGKTDMKLCRQGTCRSDVMMNYEDANDGTSDASNPKQYFCDCDQGYEENEKGRCSVNIDECTDGTNLCENDSVCRNRKPHKHGGFGYTCKCSPENFHDTNPDPSFIKKGICDGVYNDCDANPCGDNANTCVDGTRQKKNRKAYTCACASGYELKTNRRGEQSCEPTNPCDANSGYGPCQNNGVCSWDGTFNGFNCDCSSGWSGSVCDVQENPCDSNDPCENDGACFRGSEGQAACTCEEGWQGQFCQDQSAESSIATPFKISKGVCKAVASFGDAKITDDTNRDYRAFRRITALLQRRIDNGRLAPLNAMTFDFVDCSDTSNRVGHYTFYEYIFGDLRKKRAAIDILDLINDAVEDANDPNFDDSELNLPASNFTDTTNTTLGESEDIQQNIDGCQLDSFGFSGGCQNGAICTDIPDAFKTSFSNSIHPNNTCTCATGYSGDFCEISTNECDSMNCGDNGSCSDYLGYAVCVCDSGYSGDSCEVDDFCAGNLCSGRGTCVNGGCVCNPSTGYVASGDNCEVVDYCQFTDSFMVLQNVSCNFGYCAQDDAIGSYCVCDEGYGSDSFSETLNAMYNETCETLDPCASMDCGNGSCYYSESSEMHQCACDFGYIGANCNVVDMCVSANGNTCDMTYTSACSNDNTTSSGFICTCSAGYSGDNCDLGACDVGSIDYTCDDGTYSDISECFIISGQGVCGCIDDPTRTDCAVWGPACAPSASDCNGDNTASCDVNVNGTAICTCLSGYVGDYCDDLFVATTTVIVTTTEAVTTQAPVVTTQAPVVTTQAPVVTTQAPVLTTQAPGTTAGPTTPSGPTTTLPPAVMPPQCPTHPTPASEDKQVSFAYITTISNLIKDNIRGKGNCLDVIHQRIYASLQLSRDLVQYGNGWMDQFDGFQDNSKALELDNYSMRMKNNFRDAFEFCESGSCVVESFCESLSNDSLFPGSVSLKAQVEERCLAEGWRFQQIISSGTTDSCEFTYVPLPFAEKACPTA